MSESLATVAYIGAAILFILSLGGLSNPETSRRGNFYGIVGILGFFTYFTIGRADPAAREAYVTMPGLGVIAVAIGNAVFGIIRTLRVFAKAKGDL